jgi:hypothetical protein
VAADRVEDDACSSSLRERELDAGADARICPERAWVDALSRRSVLGRREREWVVGESRTLPRMDAEEPIDGALWPSARSVRFQTSAADFGVGDTVWGVLDAPTRWLR